MQYSAPLADMRFVMHTLTDLLSLNQLPGFEDATPETIDAILEEYARFCAECIAPLNHIGDQSPSAFKDGRVITSPGFKEAFSAYANAGWQGLYHAPEFGGQGLPKLLSTACSEMLNAANLSFALCPLLIDGVIEALMTAGSVEQKELYLPNLIAGKWTGTMNLTEPQAGSDLAAVRTRAEPQADGTYKLFGTKIYITYGAHDMAENIIHLVLARTPGAPAGVKGISLFLVPQYMVLEDGKLGAENDVHCISLEHKLGIKASPTAVMQFGEQGGAVGTLVGEENHGLEIMFVMMNAARFAVGVQGIAIAQRAYDAALTYAKERIQSRSVDSTESVAIIHHPDVRRMLMHMKSTVEASRALAYVAAASCDIAHHHEDAVVRKNNLALYEYLTPIVKGWSTELAQDVTSMAVQIYGGMGFIEETGVAQYVRDARILTIYEGTTAIQANDLLMRKTVRDNGTVARELIVEMRTTIGALLAHEQNNTSEDLPIIAKRLSDAVIVFESVIAYILANIKSETKAVFAGSVAYLKFAGIVLGGHQMARAALIASQKIIEKSGDADFYQAKIISARFFADHLLSLSDYYGDTIREGAPGILGLEPHQF